MSAQAQKFKIFEKKTLSGHSKSMVMNNELQQILGSTNITLA
jgi:hypothetical protein